jgi:hypothetical protein
VPSDIALRLYNPSDTKTLNQSAFSQIKFHSAATVEDQFRGTEDYFGTLPGRGIAPGAISIYSTAISIDVTVSYDEEGVVLPRG